LGKIADELCLKEGITDSRVYLERAIETISSYQIIHVSCSIEAARPRLSAHISAIRDSLARLLSIEPRHVCITATSGEGLTSFGRGEGIQAFVIVSVKEKNDS